MSRERRSLWGSISTSRKVNALSVKAALLFTWSIPHEDDDGYQEGDPQTLKHTVIPFRNDIPLEEIKDLIIEILTVHDKLNDGVPLWRLFHIGNRAFIYNPVSQNRQSFHGVKKIISKIKELIGDTPETVFKITKSGVRLNQTCNRVVIKRSEVKLREEKRSEVKGSECGKPISLSSLLKTKPEEIPLSKLDPVSRKAILKEQAKQLGVK